MRSVEKLSGDFEDKKAVSIAVGIVMERFGLSDGEAFEVLRYAARSHQEKLQTLADRPIAGHGGLELLASLSKYLASSNRAASSARVDPRNRVHQRHPCGSDCGSTHRTPLPRNKSIRSFEFQRRHFPCASACAESQGFKLAPPADR